MAIANTAAARTTTSRARGSRTSDSVTAGRLTLGERYGLSWFGSDVLRLGPDEPVVRALLEDMSRPAGHARNGEGWGEVFRGQADRLQHPRRIELDVGRLRPL